MICEKCGAQLPENAKFCLECGTPVTYPEAKPETTTSVFDELQVEEIDSDNFFGQFDNAPVEEVKPPKIEENPSVVESVEESFAFQAEEVSDPFAITPDVTPVTPQVKPETEPPATTLPNLNAENEIPINIPNPLPQTPVSAAMPDLEEDVGTSNNFNAEKAVMNSGSVNQVTMGGISSPIIDAPVPPAEPIVNPLQNNDNFEKKPDTIDDLLTDSTMNPPPLNKSDNSFAQPNFDQYSVNMMYGSNTEEEQYLRMQKEQLQPAKAFDKANTPLPGAGSNVGSDFGNTYGNGLNNNTNINAYQNNLQKGPQMQQPQSRPQMNAPYIAPQAPQMQQPQTTFGSQLNPNPSMDQAPQANASKAKDPMKKKSPVGKVIAVIVILLILGALGYIFYPYIMNFINSKSDDGSTTENTIIRQPLSSNSIVIENTATNAISNETVNNITENTIGNATATETNGVGNTTANETTSNTINLNTTSRNTNSIANTIVLTNSTTQH